MSSSNVAFSGSVPSNYDRYLGPLLFEPYALDLVNRIRPKKVVRVLELACGTGRVTQHLRNALPVQAEIFASDLNPDMISIAKNKVAGKNIEWITVDMQHIPFEAEFFDLVVCQFGIMFVPDKPKAYSEIRRVLKKGGIFLFNTWDKLELNLPYLLADRIVNSFFRDNPVTFFRIPFSYHDGEKITADLRAQFAHINLVSVRREGQSDSAREATTGVIEGAPGYGAICDRDSSLIPQIKASLEKEFVKSFGDHPMKYVWQAWVGEATK